MLFERWDGVQNEKIDKKIIVEKIKSYIKSRDYDGGYYIMLNDGRMIEINNYAKMLTERKVSRNDAITLVVPRLLRTTLTLQNPFIYCFGIIIDAYISKLGLYIYGAGGYYSAPASSLKYVTVCARFREYLAIELLDLDTVITNTNLHVIVNDVLNNIGIRLPLFTDSTDSITLSNPDYYKIYDKYRSQKLFDNYNFAEAEDILYSCYYDHNKLLANEVTRITEAYNELFKPFRVCFETKTWNQIDCLKIKFNE